jgi:hypothetical protein
MIYCFASSANPEKLTECFFGLWQLVTCFPGFPAKFETRRKGLGYKLRKIVASLLIFGFADDININFAKP